VCEKCGSFNADLAAAYNILRGNTNVKLSEKELKNLLNSPTTYVYLIREQKWMPKN